MNVQGHPRSMIFVSIAGAYMRLSVSDQYQL